MRLESDKQGTEKKRVSGKETSQNEDQKKKKVCHKSNDEEIRDVMREEMTAPNFSVQLAL